MTTLTKAQIDLWREHPTTKFAIGKLKVLRLEVLETAAANSQNEEKILRSQLIRANVIKEIVELLEKGEI